MKTRQIKQNKNEGTTKLEKPGWHLMAKKEKLNQSEKEKRWNDGEREKHVKWVEEDVDKMIGLQINLYFSESNLINLNRWKFMNLYLKSFLGRS